MWQRMTQGGYIRKRIVVVIDGVVWGVGWYRGKLREELGLK